MTTYLTNAFSINMLKDDANVSFSKLDISEVATHIDSSTANAIGHADTDTVVRKDLTQNCNVSPFELHLGQRMTVSVERGDIMIVAQYRGPRLEEGATSLPAGATIEYWLVTID